MLAILTLLKGNLQGIAIISAIVATIAFSGGFYTAHQFAKADAKEQMDAQIAANAEAQKELNAKSAKVEADLATERAKSSDLQKRWGKINATKHAVCNLSAPTLQLLRDATADSNADTK